MSIFDLFKKEDKSENIEEYYQRMIKNENNPYGFEEKFANQEEILYKMFGHCDFFNKHIRMIVISDTHNSLNEEEFESFMKQHPSYDICLLLGDHGYNDMNIILKYVDINKTYGLLGNHDNNYLEEYNINNLNGEIVNINGVSLLGIEGSYKYKPARFPSFTQRESLEFLNNKDKVDILICHDNKFNSESRYDPAHQGLFGITYYLFKNKVPYYIHGHMHDPYRNELVNGTKEISTYMYEYIEL